MPRLPFSPVQQAQKFPLVSQRDLILRGLVLCEAGDINL